MSFEKILTDLESGSIRAAYTENGSWTTNVEVKSAILEAFKNGKLIQMGPFVDKDTVAPQTFNVDRQIRIVPGGSSVRRGAYIAPGVVIMPPSYINIGAFVDTGTMIDSHVLVGSCAQIGKSVHLSAGVQIGGVLEPIGQKPVIIEDHVFVGAGSVIVEGLTIRKKAVIAPGVILSQGTRVYDAVHGVVLPRGSDVPSYAVVVPGSRSFTTSTDFIKEHGLNLQCPIIIKYRDDKTDVSLTLEEALR